MLNTDEIKRYALEELRLPEHSIKFMSEDVFNGFMELYVISSVMKFADVYNHAYTGDRSGLNQFMQTCIAKMDYLQVMTKARINRLEKEDMNPK